MASKRAFAPQSKGSVSLHESRGLRRQEETGRQTGVGIARFSVTTYGGGGHWTLAHRRWLAGQKFEHAAQQIVFLNDEEKAANAKLRPASPASPAPRSG